MRSALRANLAPKPDRFCIEKLLCVNTVYLRTLANRSPEQEKIMTTKQRTKKETRAQGTKRISETPKHRKSELKKDINNLAGGDLVTNPPTNAVQGKLSPEHQLEFDDALKIASIVLSGKSVEAALMQVRENVKVVFKDDANKNSLNAAINKKFEPHLGQEHLENINFTQEISKDDVGTFVVHISKLGLTELGRRKVAGMLDGTIPKPVEYKDREPMNGKKLNGLNYLKHFFGDLIKARAIYAHELNKLNPSLYKILSTTLNGGLSSIMPNKSAKVSSDIAALAIQHPTAHKIVANAYARA